MPTSFDVTSETSASVAEVIAAYRDPTYWLARIAFHGTKSITLDALDVDVDGGIVVRTTQDLRRDMLPDRIGQMLPGHVAITRTEVWRPGRDGFFDGEFTTVARGVPSAGDGVMALQPAPGGSRLQVRGKLMVSIPLLGGRIERHVIDLITRDLEQMQKFTQWWIAKEA